MAPQLLHRVLLTNLYVTIPMAQRVPSSFWKPLYLQCFSSYTRPSDQTQRPRLVLVKGPCSQHTLHPNARILATCPLDWRFPMEGRSYNLKPGRTLQQSTSQWNASDPECRQKCKTKSANAFCSISASMSFTKKNMYTKHCMDFVFVPVHFAFVALVRQGRI